MMSETRCDLSLSLVWEALTSAGATVYELCDHEGVAVGTQVVRLGGDHAIAVDDLDGYKVWELEELEEFGDLIPQGEYDEDAAVREASDLEGYFGIVGIPGSIHHRFTWFADEADAAEWQGSAWDAALASNPVLGTIEGAVIPASEAFDVEYRDGSKVYFQPRVGGTGFEPKR